MTQKNRTCRKCGVQQPLKNFNNKGRTCVTCKKFVHHSPRDSEGTPCPGTLDEYTLNLPGSENF